MSEHVSPLDATFLELEQADESAHMHIGGVLVFDPPSPSAQELSDRLEARLRTLPRYRQRLSSTHTGGLSWPSWEEEPDFDIARHVHRAALPSPGGEAELMEWVADYWSHRLDRRHPRWDVVILEGLADGRWALATKTHHCMVDGVGSMDVGDVLLDTEPDAPPPAPRPPRPRRQESTLSSAVNAMRGAADAAVHPRAALARSRALASLILHDEVVPAPKSSLNQPIGEARRFAVVRVPLADLKAIKRVLGGTVNDVALAAISGGLRRMLEQRGDDLRAPGLRAMVPVNLRQAGERLALGNRITSLFVHLPVHEPDAAARYAAAVHEAETLKSGSQAVGGATLISLAGLAPPVIHSLLAQSLYATRLFNLTVTNVPGPQRTLYAGGSRLREIFGLVPLAAHHSVGVAILSYDGGVTFGIVGDRDTVPDLDVLAAGIESSIDELRKLAARARRRTHRRAPAKASRSR